MSLCICVFTFILWLINNLPGCFLFLSCYLNFLFFSLLPCDSLDDCTIRVNSPNVSNLYTAIYISCIFSYQYVQICTSLLKIQLSSLLMCCFLLKCVELVRYSFENSCCMCSYIALAIKDKAVPAEGKLAMAREVVIQAIITH